MNAAYIHTCIPTYYIHTEIGGEGKGEGREEKRGEYICLPLLQAHEGLHTLDETGGRDDRADHPYKSQESISVTGRVTELGDYQCYESGEALRRATEPF